MNNLIQTRIQNIDYVMLFMHQLLIRVSTSVSNVVSVNHLYVYFSCVSCLFCSSFFDFDVYIKIFFNKVKNWISPYKILPVIKCFSFFISPQFFSLKSILLSSKRRICNFMRIQVIESFRVINSSYGWKMHIFMVPKPQFVLFWNSARWYSPFRYIIKPQV